MKEETPEQTAERIFIDCYPIELDNGNIVKKYWAIYYSKKVVNSIIKETLDEYTNDENHVRVEHFKKVLFEIEKIDKNKQSKIPYTPNH